MAAPPSSSTSGWPPTGSARDVALRSNQAKPMEMEEGKVASSQTVVEPVRQPKDVWHRIFPLRLCCLCDSIPVLSMVTFYVPDTLKTIQDWTHLTCALGMISQIIIFVVSIISISTAGIKIFMMSHLWCTREIVTFVLVCDVFPYCYSVLCRYDGALMDKKEQQRIEKEKLQKEYDNLFNDMNHRIEAFAEYAAGFATKIFEDKMRGLARWAKNVGTELEKETKHMRDEDRDQLREEFIAMLMNYAHVIQECGIDPVNHPVILYKQEELEQLSSFTAIANLVKQRCGSTKTNVETAVASRKINGWPEQTKGHCPKCDRTYSVSQARTEKGKCSACSGKTMFFSVYLVEVPAWDTTKPGQCNQCKEWFSPEQALACNGVCPNCRVVGPTGATEVDLDEVTQLNQVIKKFEADTKKAQKVKKRLSAEAPRAISVRGLASVARKKCSCCPGWITCGGCGCGRTWTQVNAQDDWPSMVSCLCVKVKVFSKDHVKLMLGMVFALALAGLHTGWIAERHANETDKVMLAANRTGYLLQETALFFILFNLLILLVRFEDLDLVQQLTREIQVLKEENVKVTNTKQEVQDTYGKLQDLNDVWRNRTIPRLELVSRTANMIEQMEDKTSRGHWALCNHAITDMERKIGAIEDWVGHEKLSTEDKKNFRLCVEHVYEDDSLDEVTRRLKMLAGGGQLKKLEGLTPNERDRPWHPTLGHVNSISQGNGYQAGPTVDFVPRSSEVPLYEP